MEQYWDLHKIKNFYANTVCFIIWSSCRIQLTQLQSKLFESTNQRETIESIFIPHGKKLALERHYYLGARNAVNFLDKTMLLL
jgi:hypothetical protein